MLQRQAQTAPQTEALPFDPGADLPRTQWKLTPERAAEIWLTFDRPEWKKPGGIETIFTLKDRKTGETQTFSFCSDRPLTRRQFESAVLLLTGERHWGKALVSQETRPFEF